MVSFSHSLNCCLALLAFLPVYLPVMLRRFIFQKIYEVAVCAGFLDLHEPYKDLSFFLCNSLWSALQGLE